MEADVWHQVGFTLCGAALIFLGVGVLATWVFYRLILSDCERSSESSLTGPLPKTGPTTNATPANSGSTWAATEARLLARDSWVKA